MTGSVVKQALFIVCIAAIPAVFSQRRTVQRIELRIPRPGEISAADVRAISNGSVIWVDARRNAGGPSIPGSVALNSWSWEKEVARVLDAWEPGRTMVVYGDYRSDEAHVIALRLQRELGLSPVFALCGPWEVFTR